MPFPPFIRPNYRLPQAENVPLGDYHLRVHGRPNMWGGPEYNGYVLVPQFHPHDPNFAMWMMADGQPHPLSDSQLNDWLGQSFFTPDSSSQFRVPRHSLDLDKHILRQLNPYEMLRARGQAPGTAPGTHPHDWMSRMVFADHLDDLGLEDQWGDPFSEHERNWANVVRTRVLNPLHNPGRAEQLLADLASWPDRLAEQKRQWNIHPDNTDEFGQPIHKYSREDGPTQYGSDVESLLQALQHPDQHEHRLGLDEPLHGPRGVLADALADVGRHAEAAIAAEPGRAVMVDGTRLFPATRIPYNNLYHSIIQQATHVSDAHLHAHPEPVNPLVDGPTNGLLGFWPQGVIPGWDAVGGPETGHVTHVDAQGLRMRAEVPSNHVRVGNHSFAEDIPIHKLPGYLADLAESHAQHELGPNHGLDEHINQLRNHPLVEVDVDKLNEMMQSGHYAHYAHSVQSANYDEGAPSGEDFQGTDRDYWRRYTPEQPAQYGDDEDYDAMVSGIRRNPLEISNHLVLADWIADKVHAGDPVYGHPGEEAERRAVANWIQGRWHHQPASFVPSFGGGETILDQGSRRGDDRHQIRLWTPSWSPSQGDWAGWEFEPGFDMYADDGIMEWVRHTASHLHSSGELSAREYVNKGVTDPISQTEIDDREYHNFWNGRTGGNQEAPRLLLPSERLLVGVDPIQNLTATAGWDRVWTELQSMLRHRHRQGQML